jgi:hypothetical protein
MSPSRLSAYQGAGRHPFTNVPGQLNDTPPYVSWHKVACKHLVLFLVPGPAFARLFICLLRSNSFYIKDTLEHMPKKWRPSTVVEIHFSQFCSAQTHLSTPLAHLGLHFISPYHIINYSFPNVRYQFFRGCFFLPSRLMKVMWNGRYIPWQIAPIMLSSLSSTFDQRTPSLNW